MIKQVEVNIPEWFELDGLSALHTVISPVFRDVGVLIAGENLDNSKCCDPIVRLYLVTLTEDKYEVTKELDSFKFKCINAARTFSEKLPNLNALDLVMLLNKEKPLFS